MSYNGLSSITGRTLRNYGYIMDEHNRTEYILKYIDQRIDEAEKRITENVLNKVQFQLVDEASPALKALREEMKKALTF